MSRCMCTSCFYLLDDDRHSVYLTLSHGVFNRAPGIFSNDKSIMVEVTVLDDKEQIIHVSYM